MKADDDIPAFVHGALAKVQDLMQKKRNITHSTASDLSFRVWYVDLQPAVEIPQDIRKQPEEVKMPLILCRHVAASSLTSGFIFRAGLIATPFMRSGIAWPSSSHSKLYAESNGSECSSGLRVHMYLAQNWHPSS